MSGNASSEKLPGFFSTYIDFLRVVAAATVLIGHYPITVGLNNIMSGTNYKYDAVVVFFILSGYVISYSASQLEKTWFNYVTNRMARVLPVSIASVLVALVIMLVVQPSRPELYNHSQQLENIPFVLFMTISFFNEVWWNNITPFGNGPYWSLAFEVWCYVIYGLLIFSKGWKRVSLLFIALMLTGPKQMLFLPLWLMGAAAYHLRNKFFPSVVLRRFMVVVPVLIYFLIQLNLHRDWSYPYFGQPIESLIDHGLDGAANIGWGYLLGALMSIHIFAIRQSKSCKILENGFLERLIKTLAKYTFSLYVFHYPLMWFFLYVFNTSLSEYNVGYNIVIYILIFLAVYTLSSVFEQPKRLYRRYISLFISSLYRGGFFK